MRLGVGKNYDRYIYRDVVIFWINVGLILKSHCQAMAETWKDLALRFKGHPVVRIADVDCTVNVDVCMNQNIEGYPTLILFKDGNRLNDYPGDRSLTSLEQFVKNYLTKDEL
jgi:thioredoxin domain-containing protein 5